MKVMFKHAQITSRIRCKHLEFTLVKPYEFTKKSTQLKFNQIFPAELGSI